MTRWVACAVVLLGALAGSARPEDAPAPEKVQFPVVFPPGVYEYRQALTAETFQTMNGQDLMRDESELAVTFTMTIWDTGKDCLLRFVPTRIEAAAKRKFFSGRYDSAGNPAAQSPELREHLSPLLKKTGALRLVKGKLEGSGIADGFNSAAGGAASMPVALAFTGSGMAYFFMEMHWVIPEKPRAPGERWKSRTAAWAIRSPKDRKTTQHVVFEKLENDATGPRALLTFRSEMPPAGGAGGTAVTLSKSEGAHSGLLRLDFATRVVTEYRDETKWVNVYSLSGPAGAVEQAMGNAYTARVTAAITATDPGPLPPELAAAAEDGEDEEHADED